MKILLVDDNKETTSMLSKFFNYKGHQIVVSNDPMEGLGYIKKEKYDVILLDINMPVISGINIIQILAAGGNLKNKNIFIFSGVDIHESQIRDLLRRDGVNGFLKKPIELDELLTAIAC
jgi:CheY-like chemotaxis protein